MTKRTSRRNYTQIGVVTVRKELRKRVLTEDGHGYTSVSDGFITADIRITVDIDELGYRLGEKAITSKGKRSQLAFGAIVGEAFNVRKED